MSSIAIHLALTLVFLASVLRKNDFRMSLLLIPFGLVSDIDSLIGVHRATFHNMFIVIIPILLFLILRNKEKRHYFLIVAALLSLHIALDTFETGVFLFYPLSMMSYDLNFWMGLTIYGFDVIVNYITVGSVGEIVYETFPTPSAPKAAIIGSGNELLILLISVVAYFSRFNKRFPE